MRSKILYILAFLLFIGSHSHLLAQAQEDFEGIELQLDQDYLADWVRKKSNEDNPHYDDNYAIALRLGIYGEIANSYYLGLPWLREQIDYYTIDFLLYRGDFRMKKESHNFALTLHGFSPKHISDEVENYSQAVASGYSLYDDRPFSSYIGFRSTRRQLGTKRFVHSARLFDMGVNTSFAFGLSGTGLARGLDNLFGWKRPDGNLWKRDETKPYPTGEVIKNVLPLIHYSVSSEIAIWKPFRKFVIQVRPELNLGHYTDFAIGIDLGKVMSVEPVIDNLSYTDTNNPSMALVNDDDFGLSIVGGITGRAVLYNYHLNGVYGKSKGHYYSLADTRKLIYEAYAGIKIQILQKVDITYSISTRFIEFKSPLRYNPIWGTIGIKYLMAPAGEGCYD